MEAPAGKPNATSSGLRCQLSMVEAQCFLKAAETHRLKLRLQETLKKIEEVATRLSCKICKKIFSGMLGYENLENDGIGKNTTDAVIPVALNCGHVFCGSCVSHARLCPHCRANIVGKQKVFFL